ncbi:MAG: hypothetical protein KC492_19330, partial [Myxococcales bacterium]|nr:hypothetical protein [Myxococcales bacterium]
GLFVGCGGVAEGSGNAGGSSEGGASGSSGSGGDGGSAQGGSSGNGGFSGNSGSGNSGSSGNGGFSGNSGSSGDGGASGSASGGGSGNGGSSGLICGQNTCTPAPITGDVTLDFPACCAAGNRCGADVSDAEALFGFTGCVELNKPGELDPACPDLPIWVAGSEVQLRGCCQANGRCGANVDVTALVANIEGVNIMGPDFGCQSPTLLGEADGAGCGQ